MRMRRCTLFERLLILFSSPPIQSKCASSLSLLSVYTSSHLGTDLKAFACLCQCHCLCCCLHISYDTTKICLSYLLASHRLPGILGFAWFIILATKIEKRIGSPFLSFPLLYFLLLPFLLFSLIILSTGRTYLMIWSDPLLFSSLPSPSTPISHFTPQSYQHLN